MNYNIRNEATFHNVFAFCRHKDNHKYTSNRGLSVKNSLAGVQSAKVATIFAANPNIMSSFQFDFTFDNSFSLALKSIEHKVQTIAADFTPFSYISGDWREIDLKADKTDLPFILFITPEQGEMTITQGLFFDGVRCLIGFFDSVNRDAYAEDNMAVYTAMRATGMQFITALNQSGYFQPITSTRYNIYTEMLASNVTGVVFDLTLRLAAGICVQ